MGRRGVWWLLSFGLVGVWLAGCSAQQTTGPQGGVVSQLAPTSQPAPGERAQIALIPANERELAQPFTLKLLDGSSLSLEDLKGKPVFLNFWGTWCGPCVREAPDLQALYRQYQGQGLQLVGVGVNDTVDTMKGKTKELGLTYPNGPSNEMATAWQVNATPTTFFLDRQGRVAGKQVGGLPRADLEAWATALLTEKEGS